MAAVATVVVAVTIRMCSRIGRMRVTARAAALTASR
jgi:hypothetical protein